jgi:hypothetical protein
MRSKFTLLLTALFLLISMPYAEAAKNYCGETVTLGSVQCEVTFEKASGTINSQNYTYRATFIAPSGTKLYKYPHSNPSNYLAIEGNGTNKLIFYFSAKPSDNTNIGWVCVNGTSSPSYLYFYSPNDINWDATCGPVLAITSATLASKTSSEIVLNVTSTEATKYKVVCSQFTRELTVSSGTAASGQITLSGLSASTTYNLTVYAMDGSGNTSSSGISLSVTTDAPPAETTPPTINNLSYALAGDGYSTANITVQATDNIGITRVVIKNGSTELLNQGVTSTTSLNQAFAVSGLPIGATTTLTVTVYDAAGNNSSKTIDVTTNTPNPQMTSASVASTTQNSVTLNVASTGGNGYKVTYGGNTITTPSTNGQITITGLNSGTTYNFTVYAMYDTYECSNPITVKVKTIEVGCSGEKTVNYAGNNYTINYKINYIGGNILFTAWCSTEGKPLTSCKLNYCTNTSGSGAVNNLNMPISNGEATYTLPATGNIASGNLYFTFTFLANGLSSETSTSSGGFSSGAFLYPIGGCALDDGKPYLQSATKAGATTSSITLDVSAVVNIDGVASNTAVTQYLVSIDGAAAQTLTATNGQITINGLTHSTSYDFKVWALYADETSENFKTVTASTNKESECEGTRGHYGFDAAQQAANPRINFYITYDAGQIKMEFEDADGTPLDFLQIEWNIPGKSSRTVNTSNEVTLSEGKASYTLPIEDAWIGNPMGILILYSNTNMNGNLQTSNNNNPETGNGVIYYVVGECGCKDDDGSKPVMGEVSIASVTTNSITLNVSATDEHSEVNMFEVNEKTYYASNGLITIKNLSECTEYTWEIKAKDQSCNLSDNSQTITVSTMQNHASAAKGAVATFVYEGNADFKGEKTIDGNLTTRGGTQFAHQNNNNITDLEGAVLTITLPEIRTINEIDIFWERACATDYELQASIDGTHWSTIDRYTDMPKWTVDTDNPTRKRGKDEMIYRFYEFPAKYLRVKPNLLYVESMWGMSIYEFEAYGPCSSAEKQCPVVLGVRSVSTKAQSAVISVSAIDRQTHNHAELTYIVTTEFTNAAGKTMTNTYTFAPGASGRVNKETTAELTLDGLIPGANYTITVKAKDPNGNESCNSNSINIRTGKAEGCTTIFEGNDAKVEGDWKPFPNGMTYRLELQNNDEGTEFTANLSFENTPADMEISSIYFAIMKQNSGTDCFAGWVELGMTKNANNYTITLNKESTYTRKGQDGCSEDLNRDFTFPLFTNWPEVGIYFKIESQYGIIHTQEFEYNVSERTCEDYFIIFHNGSEPAPDMKTQYAGGTIDKPIYYYRYVTPDQWTPLCLPFAVTAVQVYDPADKAYYDLTAKTSSAEGSFWMREQVRDVSGENFKESWYDGTNTLPQPNTAYNFRVPSDYYENKYIIFKGNENQSIATTFTLGAASTNDDQYRLYGNTTMMPQTMVQAYKEDDDGKFYRLHENWTLNPFECYVIAKGSTMARMPIIGRWNVPSITTGLENITADTMLPQISIYTTLGQPITTLYNCSLIDAQTFLLNNCGAGCYILSAQEATTKVLIP